MSQPTLVISSPDVNFCSQLREQLEANYKVVLSTHLSTVLSLLSIEDVDLLMIDQRWELSDGAVAERVLNLFQSKKPEGCSIVLARKELPAKLHAFKDNPMVKFLDQGITLEVAITAIENGLNPQQSDVAAATQQAQPEPVKSEVTATPEINTSGFG
ncbi:MAG: hypothetical protein HON04_16690, partial [Planctomicrobium sp.]|nr:hypothetical protein [Planctomicrobium sp.]